MSWRAHVTLNDFHQCIQRSPHTFIKLILRTIKTTCRLHLFTCIALRSLSFLLVQQNENCSIYWNFLRNKRNKFRPLRARIINTPGKKEEKKKKKHTETSENKPHQTQKAQQKIRTKPTPKFPQLPFLSRYISKFYKSLYLIFTVKITI